MFFFWKQLKINLFSSVKNWFPSSSHRVINQSVQRAGKLSLEAFSFYPWLGHLCQEVEIFRLLSLHSGQYRHWPLWEQCYDLNSIWPWPNHVVANFQFPKLENSFRHCAPNLGSCSKFPHWFLWLPSLLPCTNCQTHPLKVELWSHLMKSLQHFSV